ncbi:helix-turn-helix transcriptional regulator [Rheinheimera pleomorphica]|uniref:helix-turn-helix transcriptional regulator n=1 Tax=Rheinheimera pleomorphica TaxID=2703963 RepID=UPI0014214718|nr:helix-turn-helix transcriptional regulator [Rheinheimera pleomorphica]
MQRKERLVLLITLTLISVVILLDLVTDFREGVLLWHTAVEAVAGLAALGGIFYLLRDSFKLKKALKSERRLSAKLQQEAELWREQSRAYLKGLSGMIDSQLSVWQLTPAEREVAFLLLKGMSLKEIAYIRGTTEKTAKVHSTAVYAKAGLSNRAELAAFFLEDLLPPPNDVAL